MSFVIAFACRLFTARHLSKGRTTSELLIFLKAQDERVRRTLTTASQYFDRNSTASNGRIAEFRPSLSYSGSSSWTQSACHSTAHSRR
jgi:hypothetical protein